MDFYIKDLQTYSEMLAVRQLQQEIWGFGDPGMGVYPPVLNTAAKNGGVVLGAFESGTDRMVGFLFGFLGREPGGPLKLCSQAMGVLPEWRGRGVGEALKWAQRERVLQQDLPLITWTFDPLESPNAYLNLHKLGAVARRYWRDIYGSDFGQLNAGLPTDRLLAEWWIKGPRVSKRNSRPGIVPSAAAPVFEVKGHAGDLRIVGTNLCLENDLLSVEIPPNIHAVKQTSLDLAMEWRLQVRQVFETCFSAGFIAIDFLSDVRNGARRSRYLLAKLTPALAEEIGLDR
ncbi:MAG: hypothetical protein D6784_05285 [Chloroflexi bacterium]|nr:MAG: hypothetical protein D6784_05285 [Chloroflexota bacterium]